MGYSSAQRAAFCWSGGPQPLPILHSIQPHTPIAPARERAYGMLLHSRLFRLFPLLPELDHDSHSYSKTLQTPCAHQLAARPVRPHHPPPLPGHSPQSPRPRHHPPTPAAHPRPQPWPVTREQSGSARTLHDSTTNKHSFAACSGGTNRAAYLPDLLQPASLVRAGKSHPRRQFDGVLYSASKILGLKTLSMHKHSYVARSENKESCVSYGVVLNLQVWSGLEHHTLKAVSRRSHLPF